MNITLDDFSDLIGVNIELTRHSNQSRWTARLEHAEIKKGCTLSSEFGRGTTSEEALKDYATKISGELIVINAMLDSRREYNVPEVLL